MSVRKRRATIEKRLNIARRSLGHAQNVKAFKPLARAQGLVIATPPPEACTRLRNDEAHCPTMLRQIVLH
jgi:hypothetical protein